MATASQTTTTKKKKTTVTITAKSSGSTMKWTSAVALACKKSPRRSEGERMTTEQARQEARRVLRNPHKELVLAALSYVNLTDVELEVLQLRHMRGRTQERVAEDMQYSVNGLQKIEYKALDKCVQVWRKNAFVRGLLRLDEKPDA